MSINPIIIDIDDIKKFSQIAFFVDRDNFLEEVARLRESLKTVEKNKKLYRSIFLKGLLRMKYFLNIPQIFEPLIEDIVFEGKVTNENFRVSAYYKILHRYSGEIAIIIDEETSEKDLIKIFREAKKNLFKPERDTIKNIKRDRKWYWMKKSGLSYGQIQKAAEENGEKISRDGVIKAIKQYSEALSVEL